MNIENLSDDVLGAYLDGELSPEARTALERQLLGEPGARVRLDRLRESDERLRRAFALPSDPQADPLVRLLRGDSDDATTTVRALPARPRWRRFALPAGLAMAAAIGGLAMGLLWRAPAPQFRAQAGVAMSDVLRSALDHNRSGESRGGMRVVLSFLRSDGVPCRQFEVQGDGVASEGVACRESTQWRMAVWRERAATAGGYRTAGSEDSPVEQVVDTLDASGPLPPADEASLIAKGW